MSGSSSALTTPAGSPPRPHWLDVWTNRTQGTGMLFRRGMGDPAALERFWKRVASRQEPPPIQPILTQRASRRYGTIYDGWFDSPTPDLPAESRRAFIRFLKPRGEVRGMCVHLGGMAELGWARRHWIAAPLLREGIGAVFLEYPYYGRRRPSGQRSYWLQEFADQVRLFHGAVDETASLLAWLRGEAPRLAISGYSMGATVGAYTAAAIPWPASVVLSAGGASNVFTLTDSLIRRLICWEALGGETTARPALIRTAMEISLLALPPPMDASQAALVGFSRDGIVDTASVQALHEHWAGSRLTWIDTGHIGGFFLGIRPMRSLLRELILTAP